MKKLHLLHLSRCSIFKQLQIEEALLRADDRNWCILNHQTSDAIVMGISGKLEQLIDQTFWHTRPIPIIRRFSGGGTVVVDQHTFFATFICQTQDVNIGCCPKKIMDWTEQIYRPLFHALPFALQENDYVIGSNKVGGNAQYLCKNRWLHHSSFLWDFDAEKMNYLLMPPKAPIYRAGRSHLDFLCRLKDHWSHLSAFINEFKQVLEGHFELIVSDLAEVEMVLSRPHRKATTTPALPSDPDFD